MCGSMADIQSPTAEIRRGKKKEERKKEETTGQKYNVASAMQGGHSNGAFYRYADRPIPSLSVVDV